MITLYNLTIMLDYNQYQAKKTYKMIAPNTNNLLFLLVQINMESIINRKIKAVINRLFPSLTALF